MRHKKIIIEILLLTIAILHLALIFTKNHISTAGIEYGETLDEIKRMETENVKLRAQILKESSLTTVDIKARNLGFIESNNNYIITNDFRTSKNQ